jgi:hypothetical protein
MDGHREKLIFSAQKWVAKKHGLTVSLGGGGLISPWIAAGTFWILDFLKKVHKCQKSALRCWQSAFGEKGCWMVSGECRHLSEAGFW